jgi:uncharacterized protein YbbC (DUF1343 family)
MLMVNNITDKPKIIPKIPIFTMGLEILPCSFELEVIRLAMYRSTFKNFMHSGNKNTKLITAVALYFALFTTKAQLLEYKEYSSLAVGAQQFYKYVPKLKNKRVAIVTNQTGVINGVSIVDTLLKLKVNIKKIFGPEHGFRGDTDAGEKVKNNVDKKTGLPVISLYGSNKKPSAKDLKDIDVVVYDIQDLGVRFYTYISTMCYVMEACAENNKQMIVLDRPNPNGFYVDGPVLKPDYKGFLGLHPVPLVYGMTCGEYAQMVNGEGWLKTKKKKEEVSIKCDLLVVSCFNYERKATYRLPVAPSPNIPNHTAVLLYPSLGLFEGTVMSLGRGTPWPFQVLGHPEYKDSSFSFTPRATKLNPNPKYVDKKCKGIDLRKTDAGEHSREIELSYLFKMFTAMSRDDFFDKNFNYHSGNSELQEQIKTSVAEKMIRESWKSDLDAFKLIRKKYLIYSDFE